jgi:hypothetical protein
MGNLCSGVNSSMYGILCASHHSHSLAHPNRLDGGSGGDLFVPKATVGRSSRPHSTIQSRSYSANLWSKDQESTSPPPYMTVPSQHLPVARRERQHLHSSSHTATANLPAGSRHTRNYSNPTSIPTSQNHTRGLPVSSRGTNHRAPARRNTAENVLETLRKFNTVFLVDDSGSMAGALWRQVGSIAPSNFSFDQFLRPEMRSHHWRRLHQTMTRMASTSTF